MKSTPPVEGVAKALGLLVAKEAGNTAKPRFRITSEVLDRHGDRVLLAGLDVANFVTNPVLFWNHDDSQPAIGTAHLIEEGGELFMEPTFDGLCELSKVVAAKVAAGTLRTCSIRFRVLDYALNDGGGHDYAATELLEISITNIPANPEAVRVKTQVQQQKTKNETTTETPTKSLEQTDLDALGALMDAKLAPLMEKLDALTAKSTTGTAAASEGSEGAEGEQAKDAPEDEGVEMSAEEESEMKNFLAQLMGKKTK